MEITRGSTYKIPFYLTSNKGEIIKAKEVERVEFTLGNITKVYPDSPDIEFDEGSNLFILYLSQQDTLQISNTRQINYMVRVKRNEQDVKSSAIAELTLKPTLSEEIL